MSRGLLLTAYDKTDSGRALFGRRCELATLLSQGEGIFGGTFALIILKNQHS